MYRGKRLVGEKTLLLVNGDGAVTLPDSTRRALDLAPGAQVECEVVDSGIILRKVDDISPSTTTRVLSC
jgi:bifunctional DNA-binding transcriptional regulator/antitoxin component of YhaV-PrlF toxin-antitoxin module